MAKTWSGMRNRYTLKLKDGREIDVETSVVDAIRWEQKNGRPFLPPGDGNPSFEQLLWVPWAAARRQGLIDTKKFDDFLAEVEDYSMDNIDADDDEAGPDPTPPADTETSSSDLP